MKSTNKYSKALSILLIGWLLVFMCLSTSHMGNTHNINIPQKSSTLAEFANTDSEDSQHCPWTYAALMTVGNLSVSDVSPETAIDNFFITPTKSQYFYTTCNKLSARAPPAT